MCRHAIKTSYSETEMCRGESKTWNYITKHFEQRIKKAGITVNIGKGSNTSRQLSW